MTGTNRYLSKTQQYRQYIIQNTYVTISLNNIPVYTVLTLQIN